MLEAQDPEIFKVIQQESDRQEYELEMIASENYASKAVMQTQGSVLTNKYAEGYPKKRYYGGCEFVDVSEELAIERAKKLFGAEHANVQPHSGSQANMAVFLSIAKPGDTILGMDLSHGGHLTHGSPVNFSGKLFQAVHYQLDESSHRINYDNIMAQAQEHKPKILIAGYSAYPREIDFTKFREIADAVGAYLVADMAHFAGLVAAGLHPSPVGVADFTTSTTHKTLRGPRGGIILTSEENAKQVNSSIFPGMQGGPLEHVIAAKAVAFKEALDPSFKVYVEQILKNAKALAEVLLELGYDLVTGGTDNHLILMDLTKQGISGKDAETALGKAGITVNKNSVPYDQRSPFVTSGIRIGTPALTTRGMKSEEMKKIAGWIDQSIKNAGDEKILAKIKEDVRELCLSFPIYREV